MINMDQYLKQNIHQSLEKSLLLKDKHAMIHNFDLASRFVNQFGISALQLMHRAPKLLNPALVELMRCCCQNSDPFQTTLTQKVQFQTEVCKIRSKWHSNFLDASAEPKYAHSKLPPYHFDW